MKRTLIVRGLVTGALILTLPLASAGQQADPAALQRRVAALEADQKAILKELQEIKALLLNRPAPAPTAAPPAAVGGFVSIANAATRGSASAKLTMVEFSDFQCPFCGRYTRETYAQVQAEFVATGKVKYVFRNLPLESVHPLALGAAVAGECARAQGKFWEMHDRMFSNQNGLGRDNLSKGAELLGMDVPGFEKCLIGGAALEHVRQDVAEAATLGANATPAFFLAVEEKDGKVRILQRIVGAKPFAVFKTAIDTILSSPAFEN
jgi:protein-disulfide isomerase